MSRKSIVNITSPDTLLYAAIFMVTQIVGLLLSLIICFILNDFTWEFVRMALTNSLLLGVALVAGCLLTRRLMFAVATGFIVGVSSSLVAGIGIISFFVVLWSQPTLFIYYYRGAVAFVVINFLFVIALHVISSGFIIYREIMIDKERAISGERLLKNRMELQLLTSRVNPHFLFNTLNMLLSLLKQPDKAETAILNLADLLRQNLEQSDKLSIPVGQEIDNVRKYLELQKMRFGERLGFTIGGDIDFNVPPLIIQPLVENSIKHNMQKVPHLGIDVRLSREHGRNVITVVDTEKALQPGMLDCGQGLTITCKRVENSGGTFVIINGGVTISFNA